MHFTFEFMAVEGKAGKSRIRGLQVSGRELQGQEMDPSRCPLSSVALHGATSGVQGLRSGVMRG